MNRPTSDGSIASAAVGDEVANVLAHNLKDRVEEAGLTLVARARNHLNLLFNAPRLAAPVTIP
jgi:hypothetical protein